FAQRTVLKVRGEIARYERIFSLYQADSEISRLNAAGTLAKPASELRALIEESQRFGVLSAGAFDITVQPLWRLYEAHFWSHANVVDDIVARAHANAAESCGAPAQGAPRDPTHSPRIVVGPSRVALARAGMGITLNSVA